MKSWRSSCGCICRSWTADMAGRVIALDVGDVRIGVAVSDPTGIIAQPLEVY